MTTETTGSNKSEQRWALAGKILVGLGSLITVILGAFALYDRFAVATDLTVKISSVSYKTPPVIQPPVEADKKADDEEDPFDYRPRMLPPLEYNGYFVVNIENTGGTQAENVVFMFPYEGVAHLSADSISVRDLEFKKSIEVGVIAPAQIVTLWLWTKDEPAAYHEEDVRVRHSTGEGDILFLRETDGWWRTLWRTLLEIAVLLLFPLGIMFVTFSIGLLLAYRNLKKAKKGAEPPSQGRSTTAP